MRRRTGWTMLAGYAVLVAFAAIYLYPFLIQIATSFKTDSQAAATPLSLAPNPLDLSTWKRIFGLSGDSSVPILGWLGNSVLITVVVTAGGSSSTAWPATRCRGCVSAGGASSSRRSSP